MAVITLVSGGLDSTLMALLAKEEGIQQYPLFIDYGQKAKERELTACNTEFARLSLPAPVVMDLAGFGNLIPSGLTSPERDVNEDAFLPGRNSLFLLAGSSYACAVNASAVAIGLLSEDTHLFPDQTANFLEKAQSLIEAAYDLQITIVAPLMQLSKSEVIHIAASKGIRAIWGLRSHVGFAYRVLSS